MTNEDQEDIRAGGTGSVRVWEKERRDWLLPHYVRCLLPQSTASSAEAGVGRMKELEQFVDSALQDEERRVWLMDHMSAELGLAAVARGNWDRAAYYARNGYQRFLQVWSGLHPCAVAARHCALHALQRLVEIEEVCDVAVGFRERSPDTGSLLAGACAHGEAGARSYAPLTRGVAAVRKLLARWAQQLPDSAMGPPIVWSELIDARTTTLDLLVRSVEGGGQADAGEVEQLRQDVGRHLASVRYHAATSAVAHGVRPVAKRHIKEAAELMVGQESSMQNLRATVAYNRADLARREPHKRLAVVNQTQRAIESHLGRLGDGGSRAELLLFLGEWSELKAELLGAEDNEDGRVEALRTAYESFGGERQDTSQRSASQSGSDSACEDRADGARSSMRLANMCDRMLVSWEEAQTGSSPLPFAPALNAEAVAVMVVEHTLRGLNGDEESSQAARGALPRLLDLIKRYPASRQPFVAGTTAAPSWLFLRWTGQMMAVLDRYRRGQS